MNTTIQQQTQIGQTRKRNVIKGATAQARFLSYLCTKFLLNFARPKPDNPEAGKWIHIPERPGPTKRRYIDGDLIPYNGRPGHWRKVVNDMMQAGMIERRKFEVPGTKRHGYMYRPTVTDPMQYFEAATVRPELPDLDCVHFELQLQLPMFTLPPVIKTKYLNELKATNPERHAKYSTAFKFMHEAPELFIKVDKFARRVHTPFSGLETLVRPHLALECEGDLLDTVQLDLKTSQPLILGEILNYFVPGNEFTQWVRAGEDVYMIMADRAKLKNRLDGKNLFFQLIFAPPKKQLEAMFPKADWVRWLNSIKRKGYRHPEGAKYSAKKYNVVAYYLQQMEAQLMYKLWERLDTEPFLTVHDEIITDTKSLSAVKLKFENVLSEGITTRKGNRFSFGHGIVQVSKDKDKANNWAKTDVNTKSK